MKATAAHLPKSYMEVFPSEWFGQLILNQLQLELDLIKNGKMMGGLVQSRIFEVEQSKNKKNCKIHQR
jgi:hypothetical protein